MEPLSLREIQELFVACLGAGEVTADSTLVRLIDDSYGAPPTARAEVYFRAYFLRLTEVLGLDFPRSHELLGADRFSSLVRDYIRAYPSRHPSVSWFGEHFADFLATSCHETPWVAELARLEWSMVEAGYALSSPAITITDLAAIEPEHWSKIIFTPVSSLRCFVSRWPVHHLSNGESLRSLKPQRTAMRVWRNPNDLVAQAVMEWPEEAALRRMLEGKPLNQIAEVFAQKPDAPAQAAALLGRWLADGLLSSARLRTDPGSFEQINPDFSSLRGGTT